MPPTEAVQRNKDEHEQKGVFEKESKESNLSREMLDTANEERLITKAPPGINEEVVRLISKEKNEPEWMLKKRLNALEIFNKMPMPKWGPNLSKLDLSKITYYGKSDAEETRNWEDVPEDIKNTFEKLGIPEAERTVLAGVGSQYECLSGDSMVFTNPKGPKKIKEIKKDEFVFALDEKTGEIKKAKVLGVKSSGKKKVYEVIIRDRKIKASDNHPFLVLTHNKKSGKRRGRYKKQWLPLNQLKPGDLVAVAKKFPDNGTPYDLPKPKITTTVRGRNQFGAEYDLDISNRYNKISLPEKTTEDLMWFFGIYLGDGWIHRTGKKRGTNKATVGLAIPEKQKDLQIEIKKVIEKIFGLGLAKEKHDRINISSTILADFIEQCGFRGKAKTKEIPNWVFKIPRSQQLAFIAGYLDSDGHVRVNKKRDHSVSFTSANKKLLESISSLCTYCSLGTSNIYKFTSKHPFKKDIRITAYRISISGKTSTIPSRYNFKKQRLKQKDYVHAFTSAEGTKFKQHCSDFMGFAKIKSIEYQGIEPTYDIEVENYHNFVANGIIVHNSTMVYHNLKEEWAKQGVIFENMDVAMHEYPELVKEYFMTKCVPITDHKFAALHAAVWSGGTFIYIPKGVKMKIPLQAYFRMNAKGMGQFEHTLIIVDEDAEVHYIEGCSAPQYSANSLHAGCVEVYVKKRARARYSSVENWSKNTYNLNTKRAVVDEDGIIEWIGGNMGCLTGDSKVFTNPKGPVNIKSIEEGDKVFVWDEETNSIKRSRVKAKIFSGNKKVYKLEAGGRDIEASGNHPFLTLTRRKNNPKHKKAFFRVEWKPIEQLKEGDVIGIVKKLPLEGKPFKLPRIKIGDKVKSRNQYANFEMNSKHLHNKEIRVPTKTNEQFMWLMGILLGDGFVDMKENKINIATHETEDYREHLCEVIRKLFNYKVTQKKERYIVFNSRTLCKLFKEIGFTGKAKTKNIPDWVFGLPGNQIQAFIAGYFDSDGHVGTNNIAFTSINRKILEKLKLLGINLGYGVSRIAQHRKAGVVNILGSKCNANDSWRLFFNGKKIKELPARCKKKMDKIKNVKTKRNFVSAKGLNFRSKVNDEVGFTKINKITYTGIKPTYDIEVEKYHNFISNGLIVHNSGVTMLYPCSILKGRRARADHISIAFAGKGQNQDTGAKVIQLAPETSSTIKAKSISKDGGITTYRGLLQINKGAKDAKALTICDALILDKESVSNTTPHMEINEDSVDIAHEATTGRISEEKLFYLMSRGLSEEEAMKLVVSGFIEPIVKQLPLEYAVELNRLIELEMEGQG